MNLCVVSAVNAQHPNKGVKLIIVIINMTCGDDEFLCKGATMIRISKLYYLISASVAISMCGEKHCLGPM